MRRIFFAALLCSIAGCSASDPNSSNAESLGETSQDLNGALSPKGFLVGATTSKLTKNISEPDEFRREDNTQIYYNNVGSSSTGGGPVLTTALGSLDLFRAAYGFGTFENDPTLGGVTRYYNRGDLGLGREMHCVNRFARNGQIACYVTNYAAGQAGSEFTFGFSPDIAFSNMVTGNPVANVAMVYRNNATANKVIFLVYDAQGQLTTAAPLDRHGLNFATAFKNNPNLDPAKFGTPGVNFNNHIPSNCLNCHGGQYTSTGVPHVDGALFLPFDLDQFEYKNATGFTRGEQLSSFQRQNEMVRKVAFALTGNVDNPVVEQVDTWYLNRTAKSETLTHDFDTNQVISGWNGSSQDAAAYQSVVRHSCRPCHMTSLSRPFDTASAFLGDADLIGSEIQDHTMPHSLQTQRLFWQSAQPGILANYFSVDHPGAAAAIAAGGPANIVTLDPHLIEASF